MRHLVRGIAISATLALALPGVAHAGMNDRAQAAIAEARGKISASTMVGAGELMSGAYPERSGVTSNYMMVPSGPSGGPIER